MKKFVGIILIMCLMFDFVLDTFASVWISIPSTNDWLFMKDNKSIAKNEWITYDFDNDGKKEFFYFGSNGIMYKNKTSPDGKYLDNNGCYSIDGIIQKEQVQKIYIPEVTITPTEATTQLGLSGGSNVIVTGENTSSSGDKKKELKSNITKKSGVEFIDTKKIDGKSWVNTIRFSGNDSYLKANSGNYNQLSFEAGIVAKSENGAYLLTIYVNNEVLDEFDEESFNTGEKILCNIDPNSEVMMVYSCVAEDGKYLASDEKYLYLRNASFLTRKD